ncbi:MAG TPA: cytochrome c maturation protein CcmE [Acidimicrobiales bacterium]
MELSPRTLDPVDTGETRPARGRGRRRWVPLVVVAVALVALGLLITKGLADSTLYFRNVDEAIAQRDSLGAERFRLQGTVVGEPQESAGHVRFEVTYNGETAAVRHAGDPPELFRTGIPVVLEGHWAEGSDVFDSDRIMVKHDESYESRDDYDKRLDQAELGGEAP